MNFSDSPVKRGKKTHVMYIINTKHVHADAKPMPSNESKKPQINNVLTLCL